MARSADTQHKWIKRLDGTAVRTKTPIAQHMVSVGQASYIPEQEAAERERHYTPRTTPATEEVQPSVAPPETKSRTRKASGGSSEEK